MSIFTGVLVVLWILKTLFASSIRQSSAGLAFVLDLLTLLFAIPAAYYCLRLFRGLRNKLLWKIRRRLILAHIFIGAIPVFLVISFFVFSALLVYYQLSYYLISNQIGIHAAQIHAFTLSLRDGLQELMTGKNPPSPAALKARLDADARYLVGAYPSASVILSFQDPESGRMTTLINQGAHPESQSDAPVPHWLAEREFSGLAIDDTHPDVHKAKLYLRSFVSSDIGPDVPFKLQVSVPFDHYFLGRLKAALGLDLILAERVQRAGLMLQSADLARENIIETTYEPESTQSLASSLWTISLYPTLWTTGMEISSSGANALLIELSTPKLMRNLFRSENTVGTQILDVLRIIVIFFLLVGIASILIAVLLTKSITNAVHSLDRGTDFVKRGDFTHRIIVRSEDQLGALAASFNQMTEYVQDLVKERVQKERLERELEIAKEVQERLFPSSAPKMARMELAGICLPARTVSGDYYDFLPLGINELGLALGDICGKGISAALLMTNLQATLRGNVMNLRGHESQNGDGAVAELVERLNQQIFSYTSANKFATFFYALYNEAQQTLTYCNAGHNPPLYFANGDVRRLTSGGTVVGVFADSKYEQETIHLSPEDLLVAYTDGIVESVNEYGEEFGEQRLIELVQENRHLSADRIKDAIVERVLSWTFAEERDDDMTLIIARMLKAGEIDGTSESISQSAS
jgi:sigma-B regulation protein RsbU (phosphoserine phosphatase)